MESLKELVNIIRRYSLSHLELYTNPGNSDTKFDMFFNGLKENTIATDEDAIELLYPKQKNARRNFLKLKNRFKKRLVNTLFFLDLNLPEFNDYQQAYYEGYRNLALARILVGRRASKASREIALKGLRSSQKYEYSDLTFGFSKILKNYYSLHSKSYNKYIYYRDLEKESFRAMEAEQIAEDLMMDLIINFLNTRASLPDQHGKTIELLKILEPIRKEVPTYKVLGSYFMIKILHFETAFDYHNQIKTCREALKAFEKKPFLDLPKITNIANSLLGCQVKVGTYSEAESTVKKYREYIKRNDMFLISFEVNHCMLRLHERKYNIAYEIHRSVISSNYWEFARQELKENWILIGGYLYLLDSLDKIKSKDGRLHFPKFRLGKFLNEIPEFSKDKRGYNIAITILQILIFLQRREFSNIIDRMDALTRYSSRHLRKNETFRSNCFIHMMAALPTGNFNRKAVLRHAEKYISKLETMPLAKAPQSIELELIPYETLWEYTLEMLDG